ncbi:MAG: nucleotidyltransferase domain-containing protein [Candidatus Poribacteria bacterium]|nr:nucleotidyltransferase domain-containing protein [Candidatus Poribacteria bacterium]
MSNTTTAREMSPSELAECRENLKRQWENRQVDEELLQRACEAAQRVATVLYQDYGVSKVAVFGSLAELDWFHKNSDIDIAVLGISDDQCLNKICQKINADGPPHKIDLVDYERVNEYFRRRIQEQVVPIKKGVTFSQKMLDKIYPTRPKDSDNLYDMYRRRLIQYFKDGNHNVDHIIDRITKTLRQIDDNSVIISENIKRSLPWDVAMVYKAIGKIFLHIGRNVDMQVPLEDGYSITFLTQMTKQLPQRPAVVSLDTVQRLKPLLEIHNHYDEPFTHEWDFEDTVKHAKQVNETVLSLFKELDTFAAFLRDT